MALYKLILSREVRKKDFKKLPTKTRLRAVSAIDGLQSDPRPKGATRLTNREEYKLRVGNYRILYVVDDNQKQVEIRAIKHRGQVYKY